MSEYTGDEIRELTKVSYWKLRECGICHVSLFYRFSTDRTRVAFNSSCDCNSLNGWRESSWQDIADLINMQSNEETRQRMLRELKGEA